MDRQMSFATPPGQGWLNITQRSLVMVHRPAGTQVAPNPHFAPVAPDELQGTGKTERPPLHTEFSWHVPVALVGSSLGQSVSLVHSLGGRICGKNCTPTPTPAVRGSRTNA